jgi:hypothetical protein
VVGRVVCGGLYGGLEIKCVGNCEVVGRVVCVGLCACLEI